jgi:glycosyltransferase involved in cell wall biosynthesis
MRIAIEATTVLAVSSGINVYIARSLEHLFNLDRDNQYILYVHRNSALRAFEGRYSNVSLRLFEGRRRTTWIQVSLPYLLRQEGAELLHSTSFVMPLFPRVPAVLTVYDLTTSFFPQNFVLKHRIVFGSFVPLSIRKADHIVAISESTKRDIVEHFKIPDDRITVVHGAAEDRFRQPADPARIAAVREKYRLPERYILFVGVIEPRKNVPGLLEAFASIAQRIPHHLVVAGGLGWKYDSVFATVRRLGLGERAVFPGFIADEDLVPLYQGAELFVYPSFYEGFGLPVLEAMSCGVPVVTSNLSSLPEVTGNAAELVDPQDIGQIAEAMHRVLTDEVRRRRMVQEGMARAAGYSWDTAARTLLGVYRSVGGVSRGASGGHSAPIGV